MILGQEMTRSTAIHFPITLEIQSIHKSTLLSAFEIHHSSDTTSCSRYKSRVSIPTLTLGWNIEVGAQFNPKFYVGRVTWFRHWIPYQIRSQCRVEKATDLACWYSFWVKRLRALAPPFHHPPAPKKIFWHILFWS